MAAHDFILLNNLWGDAGTMGAVGEQATGYGRDNLLTKYPHQRWRSTNAVGANTYFRWDSPSGYSTAYRIHVWLGYTNARDGDKWKIEVSHDTTFDHYSSDWLDIHPTGAPTYLKQLWPDGVHAYWNFTYTTGGGVTTSYVKVSFDFTGHPDGYVEAGRFLIASEAVTSSVTRIMQWKPSKGPVYGQAVPTEKPAAGGVRADGGPLYPDAREVPIIGEYDFKNLSESEKQMFRAFVRHTGAGRDVVALQNTGVDTGNKTTDPALMENTMHGVLRNVDGIKANHVSGGAIVYDVSFDIESMIG